MPYGKIVQETHSIREKFRLPCEKAVYIRTQTGSEMCQSALKKKKKKKKKVPMRPARCYSGHIGISGGAVLELWTRRLVQFPKT